MKPAGPLEAKEAEESFALRVSCPACQVRYLSASNRGTGDNGQHLLSEPNYLLSTEEGTSGPVVTQTVSGSPSTVRPAV